MSDDSPEKRQIGAANALYPSLVTILGAVVNGKTNFITIAHVGIMNHGTPQYLSFGLAKAHYTNAGIHEHGEFSVNIPCPEMVVETDFIGMVSGKNLDKAPMFKTFTGELQYAPMIKDCPACMELKLDRVVEFSTHEVFVGEIVATYADPAVLDENEKLDITRVNPLLFDMASVKYYTLGKPVARCWNAGKEMKRKMKAKK